MPKIKLGARPKSFAKTLRFPMHDGTEGSIQVSYKYRTRVEFGEFLDVMMAEGRARVQSQEGEEPTVAEQHKRISLANADYIMKIVEGWNLDEEFTVDNVRQLCDELPAAANAIVESYRVAITEGRLGN